jgi:hypothetical protein
MRLHIPTRKAFKTTSRRCTKSYTTYIGFCTCTCCNIYKFLKLHALMCFGAFHVSECRLLPRCSPPSRTPAHARAHAGAPQHAMLPASAHLSPAALCMVLPAGACTKRIAHLLTFDLKIVFCIRIVGTQKAVDSMSFYAMLDSAPFMKQGFCSQLLPIGRLTAKLHFL